MIMRQHMLMKPVKIKFLVLILYALFLSFNNIAAQNLKNAYIIFNNNKISKCYYSFKERDNNGTSIITHEVKDYRDNGSFIICKKRFRIKPNTNIIEINKNDLNEVLTMIDFEKIVSDIWGKENMNINEYFNKIYILEKVSDNKFIGFEVYYDYNYFPDSD